MGARPDYSTGVVRPAGAAEDTARFNRLARGGRWHLPPDAKGVWLAQIPLVSGRGRQGAHCLKWHLRAVSSPDVRGCPQRSAIMAFQAGVTEAKRQTGLGALVETKQVARDLRYGGIADYGKEKHANQSGGHQERPIDTPNFNAERNIG